MHEDDTSHSRDQEGTQCGGPAAPEKAEERWEAKSGGYCQRDVMRMLPNGEAILLQIAHPGQRRFGSHPEEEPADVRMEETL